MDTFTIPSIDSFLASAESAYQDQSAAQTEDIASISTSWRKHGLRPGDIVVIALPNSVHLLWHLFGVLAAQAVPALVSPATPSIQLQEILRRFGARALVTLRPWPESSGLLETFTVNNAQVVMFQSSDPPGASPGEIIMLTSGTSGVASGCVFPFEALQLNATRHADAIGMRAGDTVLVNLPLYFSYALVAQVIAAWLRGAKLVVSGPPFHVPSYLALLAQRQITVSSLTPILVRKLLQYEHSLPDGLRVMTVGGDLLAPQHVEQLLRRYPNNELYLTYGLTEAGPRVATLAAHQEPARRFASAGLPLQGTHIRLEGTGISADSRELLISSETLMRRRIGFVEGRSGKDWRDQGFLATGDLFDLDEDGYLYFRGRLSDFLIKDGEKVNLTSVRRFATSVPGVIAARTNIFAEAGEKTGFDLTVHVADQVEVTEKEVRTKIYQSLRGSERPRNIDIVATEEQYSILHK